MTRERIAVIKYNAGNIWSMVCALNRLGIEPDVTDDPHTLYAADRVIFPGVGEASSAMRYLKQRGLDEVLRNLDQPFLGVCLGMQLMCRYSEEQDTECLGIFSEEVRRFPKGHKVPHMGWNSLYGMSSGLFSGIPEQSCLYFVHSYYVPQGDDTIAGCQYIIPFSAALGKGNRFGTQFHPEKSGRLGLLILRNFERMVCNATNSRC